MTDQQIVEIADRVLRLRGAPIIHDTIDNETIAINQQTGRYYSLEGPAAITWQWLETGATAEAIARRITGTYAVEPDVARAQVDGFLGDLLAEGLIVADGVAPAVDATDTPTDADRPADRQPFNGLSLHRYTDMEVLLLADPIHDVDETGWPSPQRDATA